jgi:DNA invertase Pin-like site-specific DNA recombinase
MKSILLARVSSKEQEDGQSIPAQTTKLREYAEKNRLNVVYEFQLTESSTKQTRKEFSKIIGIITKSKECIALVVDTVDRLQRSFKESVELLELLKQGNLTLHFLRERLVLDKDSNSSDLMRWDMNVLMARSYVLQLADNVKRSLDEARKNGIRASLAPLGYLNVKDNQNKKDVIPDPTQSYLIVKMFEMYATGNYSIRQIAEEMEKLGLKSKRGNSVVLSKIDDALKDPFYYGVMKTKNGLYPHRHEPLISIELFEKVQKVRLSRKQKPFQPIAKPFIFRGLITCSNCQCLISPEIKKKEYIYYSCTNAKKTCKRIYIKEEVFLKGVGSYFEDLCLSQETIDAITLHIKESYDSEHRFFANSKREAKQRTGTNLTADQSAL